MKIFSKWRILPVALGMLAMSGCSSYLAPLCEENNRKDIPNFEGSFSTNLTFVGKEGSLSQRIGYTITRVEKGVYLMESTQGTTRASVCEIDGHYYAEDNNGWSSTLSTQGYVAFQVAPNGNGSFDMISLGVDSKLLDAQQIPYSVIEVKTSPVEGVPGSSQYYNLLVDNRGIPAERFVQLLDPMSLKITLQPGT
jgi:hypothetical protein